MMRRIWSDLFLFLLALCLCIGFIAYAKQFSSPLAEEAVIDLSLLHLPEYTFFSLSRGLLAFTLSLLFSLSWGFWSAKDRWAEKILIPLLDVLQSVPFLGFLPGVVLLLVSLFPYTNVGLELAAIMLMFTGQAWNMAFGVYRSLRTVPIEKNECATAFGFTLSERFRWVEFPFAMLSLIWNSIMSMAGGWFFLMINEAFTLGNRDFRLPGLGSYMSVAVSQGDVPAMINAIIAMVLLIVFLDQVLWRPLVVWSQRYRIEETGSNGQAESWFLNILSHSHLTSFLSSLSQRFADFWQNRKAKTVRQWNSHFFLGALSRIALFVLLAALSAALFFIAKLLREVPLDQWLSLGYMLLLTLSRVAISVLISVAVMLPLGLAIGLSDKWSGILQPIIQVAASFPATLLFPALIITFKLLGISLGIGSVLLMLMGTQWYVLFNVMAGARAMPSDLREAARAFEFSGKQRFFTLSLPAVFPYLITGVVTASGGAWNASIVAEYVSYNGQTWTTPGIGSSISLAAQNNNYPLLAASVLILALVVVLINYQVWLRLYHYSEKRFALNV